MRNGINHLFVDASLSDALQVYEKRARDHVDAINEREFASTPDDQLISKVAKEFTVTPIELDDAARTMQQEEIDVDVSHDPFRFMPPGHRGPAWVRGIRVIVRVPFHGDPELWRLKPNMWRSRYPYGVVHAEGRRSGTLEITIDQPADQAPEKIQERYESNVADINFYLQSQRSQIDAFNANLQSVVAGTVGQRRQRLQRHSNLSGLLGIPKAAPAPVAEPPTPAARATPARAKVRDREHEWDVFLSHAFEDKETFARALAEGLRARGLRVWFDEFTLRVGDGLRRSIDRGLARSNYGVVLISPAFLSKEWPQKELDGLAAREANGRKVILPVWHNITAEVIRNQSPMLADRVAAKSADGLEKVLDDLLKAVRED